MKRLTLKLTVEELSLLAALASDQLFRREFIDRRIPGYKCDPGEMDLGKALLRRLRLILDKVHNRTASAAAVNGGAFTAPVKRQNRIPSAV